MATTFADIWRRVRLYVPSAPVLLVQAWVRDAYRQLADMRGWGWLVMEDQIAFQAARSLATVTATVGSSTVTSAGLFLPASDPGRQFRVGSYPIYTILTCPDVNTITLDRTFQPPTLSNVISPQTAQILDAYATMPLDFGRFVVVLDPLNQRIVPWWATEEELSLIDPTRQAAENVPRLLVGRRPSTYPPTFGQMQYEYWPKPQSTGALQYYAIRRPTPMADDAPFIGVLADRSDILETGALARAARWPGTSEVKNPYFNIALAAQLDLKFAALANQLDLRDDDQLQQSWTTIPWQRWQIWAWAYDTRLLQATDSDLGAYAGFGYYGAGQGW